MSIKNNTASLQQLLEAVNNLPDAGSGGVELPELLNPGNAADLLEGKELINQDGEKIIGTIPIRSQDNLQITDNTVLIPSGYYDQDIGANVARTTQVTPTISVNSSGLITATATQSEGYVEAGTKTETKQLTTQATKTITPTKSEQTVVPSGVYTTGDIKVAPIPDEYVDSSDATSDVNEVFFGETFYANGEKKIGTFTIASELSQQDELLAELEEILDTKSAAGGEANPILQIKTVSPTTSVQTITADSAYDGLKTVIVEAIPVDYVIPQGTLEITENKTYDVITYELVDVNVPVPSGYIKPSGTFEVTENGVYDITEYAAINVNIASSGGGTDTRFADLVSGTITEVDDDTIITIKQYGFAYTDELKSVNLPNATTINPSAFRACNSLETVNLPSITGTLGSYTFYDCSKLKTVNVPLVSNSSTAIFQNCVELEKIDFGTNMATLGTNAFSGCSKLTTLIIRGGRSGGTTPPNMSNVNALANTPIADGTGYVYVSKSLIDKYKTATNWSAYAAQIRAIEDYPEICG